MAREEERGRNLPEELQDEILRRLPIKSLIRFESVCQTWRSKFHSRLFIDLYGRQPCQPGGVVCKDDNLFGLHTIDKTTIRDMIPGLFDTQLLDYLNNTNNTTAPGKLEPWVGTTSAFGPTSDGVYCLLFLPTRLGFRQNTLCAPWVRAALCNPATRDHKLLDPFPPGIRYILSSSYLELDSQVLYGFGKLGSEHRVVVIARNDKSFVCLVHNSQQGEHGGEWRKVVDYKRGRKRNVGTRKNIRAVKGITYIVYDIQTCPQKFLEGCWHWGAERVDNGEITQPVLSFSFADESFKLMGIPVPEPEPDLIEPELKTEVFVWRDRYLAMIFLFGTLQPDPAESRLVERVDIWAMMEYGVEESWTRVFMIKPDFHGMFRFFLGVECTPDGDIERLFCQGKYEDEDRIYSLEEGGHKLCGRRDPATTHVLNNPGNSTYIETLERL